MPTNSSKQYHNQQNHHSIQFDSIRFNSNLSNPFSPLILKSVQIGYPFNSLQYLHSAASIVAAFQALQSLRALQTIQVAAVRVPSSSLSTLALINAKFPHLALRSHIPFPIEHSEAISSVVRDSWPAVNPSPLCHPDHSLGNTLSVIDFEISVTSSERLLSTNTLLLSPSSIIVSTFHHDSVCS